MSETSKHETMTASEGKLADLWIEASDRLPDGMSPVLAFFVNEYGRPRIIRAGYARLHEMELDVECCGGCTCGECEGEFVTPGWYENNEHEEVHWHVEGITHWMPLPAPPSTERSTR
jgi:hypothetical protein